MYVRFVEKKLNKLYIGTKSYLETSDNWLNNQQPTLKRNTVQTYLTCIFQIIKNFCLFNGKTKITKKSLLIYYLKVL